MKILGPYTQADGAQTFDASSYRTKDWQIGLNTTGSVSAGTLAIEYKTKGATAWTTLRDASGNAVTMNMQAPQPIEFSGWIDSFRFTPTGFNGTNYSPVIVAGFM